MTGDAEDLDQGDPWAGIADNARPVPARISWALDSRGLEGPEVDEQVGTFEGNPAGDVDDWEDARAVPTRAQVAMLAELTRYPPAWFYQPVEIGPTHGGGWIHWGNRAPGRRCERLVPDVIDARGVLLPEGRPRPGPEDKQLGLFDTGAAAVGGVSPRPPDRQTNRRAPKVSKPPAPKPVAGPSIEARALLDAAVQRGRARWRP